MWGTIWPPMHRFKEILEDARTEWQEENGGMLGEAKSNAAMVSPTPVEEAVQQRAFSLGVQERNNVASEIMSAATLGPEAKAPEGEQQAEEKAKSMDEDMTITHSGSSEEGNKSASTPVSKRTKPNPKSPSQRELPRDPAVLEDMMADANKAAAIQINLEAADEELRLATETPKEPTAFANFVTESQERVQAAKAAIMQAQFEGGNAAAFEVKKELVERYSEGEHTANQVEAREAAPPAPPAPSPPEPSSSSPKAPSYSQVSLSIKEMEMLYLKVRERNFTWTPDEEGFYQVAEIDSDFICKLDGVVPKGTGKSCGSSIGAKYTCAHIRSCYIDANGDEQYANTPEVDFDLMVPDIVWNQIQKTWCCCIAPSHDFVPSKEVMATTLYADSKVVKFAPVRNRGHCEWTVVDTTTSSTKLIPTRLYDCSKYIDFKQSIDGPYPQCLLDYCDEKDKQLMKLINECMLHADSFLTMREHYPTLLLPKPIVAFHQWAEHDTQHIIDAHANMLSRDIVKEEEDAALKNNKSGDVGVPKQVYEAVLKAIIPRRAMAERLGKAAFHLNQFQLPITPLRINVKDPPFQAAQKRKKDAEEKRSQGRQPGPLKAKPPASTQRTSRQQAADEAKKSAEKEAAEKQKAADAAAKKHAAAAKKHANTTANAAAGRVNGGQPMPSNAHNLPAHLSPLSSANVANLPNQYRSPEGLGGSPTSSLPSAISSQASAAITEMHSSLKEMREEMKAQREEFTALLKEQSEGSHARIVDLSKQLAASQATVVELREANASSKSMQKTLENMCNSMLKTMENMQVAGAK